MPAYIVRPYYGHDCNSESGFNDGHYLDPMTVAAEDEDQAKARAMSLICDSKVNSNYRWTTDSHFGLDTLYQEYGHIYTTKDGSEYHDEDNVPGDETYETFYLYQYIDFNDVQLAEDNGAASE